MSRRMTVMEIIPQSQYICIYTKKITAAVFIRCFFFFLLVPFFELSSNKLYIGAAGVRSQSYLF